MIAVRQQQSLPTGQAGEEVRVLRRREDRVLEGIGQEHGRLPHVDLVDHRRGRPRRRQLLGFGDRTVEIGKRERHVTR